MEIRRLEKKCNKCMLCVKDCASGVWRDIDGIPTVVAPKLCNRCSHCLAVCKRNAIEHDILDTNQIKLIDKKMFKPEVYKEIVRSRRSIRYYKDKDISQNVIDNIIDLARYSPTASNDQNVKYIVVTNKKLLRKISEHVFGLGDKVYGWTKTGIGKLILKATGNSNNRYLNLMEYSKEQTKAGRDFILHNAPVLILLLASKKAKFAVDNCNIAATNIINYSHSKNLGTCYIGFLTLLLKYSKTLNKLLDIPKNKRVFVSLVMGYPEFSHTYTVSRKNPKVTFME